MSKLERQFYSRKNYKLLEDVLTSSIDVSNIDFKEMILENMENVFQNPPKFKDRKERSEYLKELNKTVLSKIVSRIKGNPDKRQRLEMQENIPQPDRMTQSGRMPQPDKMTQSGRMPQPDRMTQSGRMPQPDRMTQSGRMPQPDKMTQSSQKSTPINFLPAPESDQQFSRFDVQPPNNLYPQQDLQNFPEPKSDRINNNTNVLFSQIEKERSETIKKPEPIDFSLPNINPENRFQEIMEARKKDDFMMSDITNGLDENLLNVESVVDVPASQPRVSQPVQMSQPRVSQPIVNPTPLVRSPEMPQIPIPRYLTISSKERNALLYPSPSKFSVQLMDNINSIECLDVVLPKDCVKNEPFLWLCVQEIPNQLNIGNVPEGAFARLKPIHTQDNFVSMRAHIIDNTYLDKKTLTLSICDSDCILLNIQDRLDVKIVKNNISVEAEQGDKLYFYSYYSNITDFEPNVLIHSLQKNNNKLSLRFGKGSPTENKISKNNLNKFTPPLSVGDVLFLQHKSCDVIDVKDDLVTIKYRGIVPSKITHLSFIKKNDQGYSSENEDDLNYKGGVIVKDIVDGNIVTEKKYKVKNNYFAIQQKKQVHYMFRVTD